MFSAFSETRSSRSGYPFLPLPSTTPLRPCVDFCLARRVKRQRPTPSVWELDGDMFPPLLPGSQRYSMGPSHPRSCILRRILKAAWPFGAWGPGHCQQQACPACTPIVTCHSGLPLLLAFLPGRPPRPPPRGSLLHSPLPGPELDPVPEQEPCLEPHRLGPANRLSILLPGSPWFYVSRGSVASRLGV